MIDLGLLGLLIILVTTGTWFWRAWRVRIPTSTPYPFIMLWALGLVLGIVALMGGTESSYAAWAVGVSVSLLYLIFTGAQKVSATMINVGDQIPAFTGTNDEGETFDSSSLAGSRVLIKFFRGHW